MSRAGVPLGAVVSRLEGAGLLEGVVGGTDLTVHGAAQDSRVVEPGNLFLAWKGAVHDAHEFLPQAASAGAVAAVVEHAVPHADLTQVIVSDGRAAAALAADEVWGRPWERLMVAGVTGTNGKTTVALLLRHLLGLERPTRALGTLGLVEEDGRVRPGSEGLTTPGPVQVAAWLGEMAAGGVEAVVLEASSHALEQRRLDGVRFDAVAFTNLGRDHLDYHPSLDAYREAKGRLLKLLKDGGHVVVNGEEPAWRSLDVPEERTVRVAIVEGEGADTGPGRWIRAEEVALDGSGSRFRLREIGGTGGEAGHVEVTLPLLGRFNVENAVVAAALGRVLGLGLEAIASGLSSAPQVPGRLERVHAGAFTVLIDFAHTPEALERVLVALRPLVAGRLLVLFGAGGDRDRGKRPAMGAVVARHADLAFVTSDNPRTEDPERILDDIVAGMGGAPFRRITDRREAIGAALGEARPGDLLLLAGKGHESYQVVGRERRPFVEREIVRDFLSGREGRGAA